MTDTAPSTSRQSASAPDLFSSRARGLGSLVMEATPLVALTLIVALMGALIWLADRRDREEAGDALIRDALWVEQALRFQIDAGRDTLERQALDMAGTPSTQEAITARLRTVVATHPEIAEIEWRDEAGHPRVAVPPDGGAAELDAASTLPPRGFGEPRRLAHGGAVVDLTIPLFDNDLRAGSLTAHIHLDRLLAMHVPWWISQNNNVALTDRDGVELARKSTVAANAGAARHDLGFDPPLPGVVLTLTAHGAGSNPTRNLLGVGIFALAIVAVVSLFGLVRHYHRRLAAEQSLGEALALRRAMEESLTVGMRARDLDDRILYVNPAFCRMVGWRAEDLIGRTPPLPYWLPELVEETLARHQALAAEGLGPISFETRFRRADGTVFEVLVYEAPLIDAGGVHRGWMGSIIDITDRKKAEEMERLQAEKMAQTGRLISLGEMASTISHELNQPLAAIASYASGCLHLIENGRSPGDLVGALRKLDAQAQRAGQVIRRVHDFVRKRDPSFVAIDLSSVIADVVAFISPDARKLASEIVVEPTGGPLPVRVDPILIEQVLFNLMRNGMEAMAGLASGDKVLTVAARLSIDPAEVVVTVADRGSGIPPEVAARLFSPFFSTKHEGMGMGLSICRSIVERHQGRLEFTDRAGGGTVFTLTLPVAEEDEARA